MFGRSDVRTLQIQNYKLHWHGPAPNTQNLVGYLESLGLGHTKQAFLDNGVDGDILASLSDEELQRDLGLTKIQARKVRARLPA